MEYTHLLGTMSDAAIARMTGVTPAAIRYHRCKLGIPRYGVSAPVKTPRIIQQEKRLKSRARAIAKEIIDELANEKS